MMNWPQYVIDQLGREPKVGDWFCPCCIEDFRQLTLEEMDGLPEFCDDMGDVRFWPTEYPARTQLEHEATWPSISDR